MGKAAAISAWQSPLVLEQETGGIWHRSSVLSRNDVLGWRSEGTVTWAICRSEETGHPKEIRVLVAWITGV